MLDPPVGYFPQLLFPNFMKGTIMSTKLVVARILAVLVANSQNAPSAPSRKGDKTRENDRDVILQTAMREYPTDGEFLLTKELHLQVPGGGQFFLSRTKPLPPTSEGIVKKDRREGKRLKHPEVERRLEYYGSCFDQNHPIDFLPYPPEVLDVIMPEGRLQALAERLGLGVGGVDETGLAQ